MTKTKYAIHHNKERLPEYPQEFEWATFAAMFMILKGLKESDGYEWEPVT